MCIILYIYKLGLDFDIIRQSAGWSERSQTFYRFYNKNIENNANLASTLLSNVNLNNVS